MQGKQRDSGNARVVTGIYHAKDVRENSRSSKHRPAEMSSKKAVSRRREVVPTTKRNFRDPRFEPLSGLVDQSRIRQNYSFLDDYQADERRSLKEEIKKTRDEPTKDSLKRALLSMVRTVRFNLCCPFPCTDTYCRNPRKRRKIQKTSNRKY